MIDNELFRVIVCSYRQHPSPCRMQSGNNTNGISLGLEAEVSLGNVFCSLCLTASLAKGRAFAFEAVGQSSNPG